MLPNRSISGSFWYWGAPPDSVMTVAIVRALRTVADIVAANAANQSREVGRGVEVGDGVEDGQGDDRDEPEVREVERDLDRPLA